MLGSDVYRRDVTIGIRRPEHSALAYLLQHRVGLQFLENRRVGDAQDVVNDVNETVGWSDVWLNDGGVHAAALHGDCLCVVPVHNIEVQEFLIDVGRDLNNLRWIEWRKDGKRSQNAMKKMFLSSSIYLVIVIGADFLGTESFIDEM